MEKKDVLVNKKTLKKNIEDALSFSEYSYIFNYSTDSPVGDASNSLFAEFSIDDLIEESNLTAEEKINCHQTPFSFFGNSWQSWGEGAEVLPGARQKKYVPIIPPFKKYVDFPGLAPKKVLSEKSNPRNLLEGYFVIYLRWNDLYLCVASTSKIKSKNPLPPVKFYVDSKRRRIYAVCYADGKKWKAQEKIGEITTFFARGYFALSDSVKELFGGDAEKRFESIQSLNCSKEKILTGGWESWYNHYNHINQKLIEEDLENLSKTENLIKKCFIDNQYQTVFQVDDGWERGLGEWTCNEELFPDGMMNLATKIVSKGYVPGLWLAPFIVDLRTDFSKRHRDWILLDKKGKPVTAGFNFAWGAAFGKDQPGFPYSYYCYDLSKNEVITFLDMLMEKVVNEWGFRYIKLDFLFAGMLNGKFKNGGTAYEWYDRAIKVLTSRKKNKNGQSVTYLGCGIPFETGFKDFPLSRIGPDTKEAWDYAPLHPCHFSARPGAYGSLKATLGRSFWDQGVFINDPDVVFMRYENIKLNDVEKECVALVNYLFASQIMHSDDPVKFDEGKEAEFTNKIFELYKKFENEQFGFVTIVRDVYVIFSRNGKYAGIVNLSGKKAQLEKSVITNLVPAAKTYCNFKPVVAHVQDKGTYFEAEKHSISIFEI